MRLSVTHAAADAPDRPALVSDSGVETYSELAAAVRARIAAMRDVAGCARLEGVSVAVVAGTRREDVVNVVAAFEERVRLVVVHPRIPFERREAQLRTSGAALVVDGATVMRRDAQRDDLPAWAALVFTSGSTTEPRGVRLTRDGLLAAADASAANLGWRDDDRWLLDLPLAHVGGLSVVTRCLAARRAIAVSDLPLEVAILRTRATLASLVPTQLRRLLDSQSGSFEESALRACLVGGAATPPDLVREARERGLPVLLTWGMSEAGSQLATQPPEEAWSTRDTDLVTVGRPLPGVDLRIRDGRAFVRGPMVMAGYLPPTEPATPDADGWLDTGDRVRWLDGDLQVLGRECDLVISGGENVSPLAVEARLCEHPSVRAAAVVGVPDAEWGEVVAAAIVWVGAPDEDRLLAWCRDALPPWERPRLLRAVPDLPTGPTGKVDSSAIRALFR